MVGFGLHALHDYFSTLHNTAMLGPSHPDTKARYTGTDDTIFYVTAPSRVLTPERNSFTACVKGK